jgi:hypothetical protein
VAKLLQQSGEGVDDTDAVLTAGGAVMTIDA